MDQHKRRSFFYIVTFIVLFILSFRLIQLQLIHPEEFGKESQRNSIKTIITAPARGLMVDRNGKIMVDNKPSYTVMITKSEFDTNNINLISTQVGRTPEEIRLFLQDIEGTHRFIPQRIARDVDFRVISFIEENSELLKGINYKVEPIRAYSKDISGAHMIGYNKEISKSQLKAQTDDYYNQGDIIGTTGLEASYEKFVRGEKGREFILQDSKGREVGPLNEGMNDVKSVPGYDLLMGVDMNLQMLGERLMGNNRGGIVAIDPQNGEILCMVSKPDFDLNLFAGKLDSKVWVDLNKDPVKPLFNRATMTRYPPGSTYKMVTAVASLQEGIMKPNSTIVANGSFQFGNKVFKDHGSYGAIGFVKSIEVSSNVFYYKLVLMVGLDNYHKYGSMFGFGQKSGIDIPEETKGLLPSREYYDKVYGVKGWTQGYIVSLGIGQGELGVSPVQMAVYTSILANGGTHYQPHFVRALRNPVTGEIKNLDFWKKELPVDKKYMEIIREGMYQVVNGNGTGRRIKSEEIEIAGKTGTAQNPHGQKDHSWFIAFAPYHNPKIAIAVMVENAGFGAAVAAPIAGKLINYYLLGRLVEDEVVQTGAQPD